MLETLRSAFYSILSAVVIYIFLRLQLHGMTPPEYDFSAPSDQIIEAMDRHGAFSDFLVKSEIIIIFLLLFLASATSRAVNIIARFFRAIAIVLVGVVLARSAIGLPIVDVRLLTSFLIASIAWCVALFNNIGSARGGQ